MTDREIDAHIALNVFGLKVASSESMSHASGDKYWYEDLDDNGEFCAKRIPFYSTDIKDAWNIIYKIDFETSLTQQRSRSYRKWVFRLGKHQGVSENICKAICLAALKAKGIEVKND